MFASYYSLLQSALPEAEILAKMRKVDLSSDEYAQMPEGEQFVAQICTSMKMFPARLQALVFVMRFDENVGDLKPAIVAVKAASEEICKSRGFATFLEMTLLTGNYMSASAKTFKQSVYAFNLANLINVSAIGGCAHSRRSCRRRNHKTANKRCCIIWLTS